MLNEKGQTLMELVVVIAVAVIVISALTFATIGSLRNSQFAKNQAQATKLAQEGLEKIRTGRDRNKEINNLHETVRNWETIWGYQIEDNCGNTTPPPPFIYCYFNLTEAGGLNYLVASSSLPSNVEAIPPFKRAIILSDEAETFGKQKKVTVIVQWSDFAGEHESRLTTILRKI